MSGKGQPGGPLNPAFKHGRYVGQKKQIRQKQTGVAKKVRQWIHSTAKKQFLLDDLKAALPLLSAVKISYALHGLKRSGEIKAVERIAHQNVIWEIVEK
jgi:hypothetical protein